YTQRLRGDNGSPLRSVHGSLGRDIVPAVEVDHLGQRSATHWPVPSLRPADHDVPGQHPVVGHADGVPQQLLAAVGSPTGQTRTQALSAGGQQEVLHRRKNRTAQQEFRRRRKVLLREQNRREFTGPVVQLVGGPVGAGASAVVVGGRSG